MCINKMRWEYILVICLAVIAVFSLISWGIVKATKNSQNSLENRLVITDDGQKCPVAYYMHTLYPLTKPSFWINKSDQDLVDAYTSMAWFFLPLVYPLPEEWGNYKSQIGTWADGLNITPETKFPYYPSLNPDLGDYGIALSGSLRGASVFGCSVFGSKGSWHSEWDPTDSGRPYNAVSYISPWSAQRYGVPNYAYIETQTYACEELGRALLSAPTCDNKPPMIQSMVKNYCDKNKCFGDVNSATEIPACNTTMYDCPETGVPIIDCDSSPIINDDCSIVADSLKDYEAQQSTENYAVRMRPGRAVNDQATTDSSSSKVCQLPSADCILNTSDWNNPDDSCNGWTPDDCPAGSLAYADDTVTTCMDFTTKSEGTYNSKPYCQGVYGGSPTSYCSYSVNTYYNDIGGNICANPQALWNFDTLSGGVYAVDNGDGTFTPWPRYLLNNSSNLGDYGSSSRYYAVRDLFNKVIFQTTPIMTDICPGQWIGDCSDADTVTPTASYSSSCGSIESSVSECPIYSQPDDPSVISPNAKLTKPGKFMFYWMRGYGKWCNMGLTGVYYNFVHFLLTMPNDLPNSTAKTRYDPMQILSTEAGSVYLNQLTALCSGKYRDPRKYIQGFVTFFRKGNNSGYFEEVDGGEDIPNDLPFTTQNTDGKLNPLDSPFLQAVDAMCVGKYYATPVENPYYGAYVAMTPYKAVLFLMAMHLNGDSGGDCPGDLVESGYNTYCGVSTGSQPSASTKEPWINGNGYYPFGLYFPGSNLGTACYALGYNLGWDSMQMTQMPTGAGRKTYETTSMYDWEGVFLRDVTTTCQKYVFTVDISKDYDNWVKTGYVRGSTSKGDYDSNIAADKSKGLVKNFDYTLMPLIERNMPDGSSPNALYYPQADPPIDFQWDCVYTDDIYCKNK